ncbi:methionine--tRNA ligase [Actinoplanes sp. NPDC049802]|uniref:methionine--tRNA ligase n=1 Tax=Actinoplanes sp. NPDC049802 TaxID=3154742 RepID=UPI0033D0374A
MSSFYVTTAIPYVNAAPHLGHALELVQADVLARHARLRGRPARFLTGTDDNALKNVTAARAAGVDVRGFVDRNAARYAGRLLEILESGRIRIEPAARRNEVLAFVRAGLTDLSVSRPAARAGGWGIPVPGDPGQVIYVWWDALANYVTALGYGADDPDYRRWWDGPGERAHVIGKGIVRFHAVHWPALLLSAGLPLPTAVLVHDYLTVDGAKIAKSGGNTVDPAGLVERYGTDAVRWWLLRDVARLGESDFTEERLVHRADTDLANGLGNLVSRTLALPRGEVPEPGELPGWCTELPDRIDRALRDFDFRAATGAVCAVVDEANRLIEAERPWKGGGEAVSAVLTGVCRVLATEVAPFLPDGATRLAERLRRGGRPQPVFPRLGQRARR